MGSYFKTRKALIGQSDYTLNLCNLTYLIFTIMYLSGISPSLPFTLPFHQSFDTCVYRMTWSPFFKLNSLSDLALKSNWAVASRDSVSETNKIRCNYYVGIWEAPERHLFTFRKNRMFISRQTDINQKNLWCNMGCKQWFLCTDLGL